MKTVKFFILLLFVSLMCSCRSIFMASYGMSSRVEILDKEGVIKYGEKFNIASNDLYELDTTYYDALLSMTQTSGTDFFKEYAQFFQAMYFDKNGKLITNFIGCYAKMSFPNVKWNANKEFDTFPPAQQVGHPLDTLNLFNWFKVNQCFKKISEDESITEQQYDYYVVVFWSTAGGRQSKRLINTVQNNLKLTDAKVKSLFVNTNNYLCYEYKKGLICGQIVK